MCRAGLTDRSLMQRTLPHHASHPVAGTGQVPQVLSRRGAFGQTRRQSGRQIPDRFPNGRGHAVSIRYIELSVADPESLEVLISSGL